jgi:type VI secretion system secreted protein Hcp
MILLKLGKIKGDSTVKEHTDWITCDSAQFGVARPVTISGGGKSRDTSNPSFSDLSFTKSTDMASADLFYQAMGGKALGKAEVHFIQTSENKTQVYLKLELEEALVTSYSASSGGERPMESFSINFTKITYQYDDFSGDKVTTGDVKKWDLMVNAAY